MSLYERLQRLKLIEYYIEILHYCNFFSNLLFYLIIFLLLFITAILSGVVKIEGPWTRSMKGAHGPGP